MDHPLWQLTLARWKELYREPGIVFWVFGFPILLAIGLGVAFQERPLEPPRVAVVAGAPWLGESLDGGGIDVQVLPLAAATEALARGRVDLVVADGAEPWSVDYTLDPMRPESRLARATVDATLQDRNGRQDAVSTTDHTLTEAGTRYVDFLLPGLIGLNLMGSSLWGIAYSVVLSRKRRLLKRLAATPMRRSHYLLSYLLSRTGLLIGEVAALVLVGWLFFDVGVQGSLVALGVIAAAGAAAFAGLALLIAARIDNTEIASGWMNFVMLPMWILSGSFFSYERFPAWTHGPIQALPLTALNDALRAVMSQGASLVSQWPELAVLTAWGGVSFAVAVRRFKWQ